jgi:histidine triad (HIT) family protein
MTVFEKIATRQIPARIIHETEDLVAFHDSNPQAPIHVLIVPRRAIPRTPKPAQTTPELLGKLLLAATEICRKVGRRRVWLSNRHQ